MPDTEVLFYQEKEGSVPLVDWLRSLPPKVQDKCAVRLERLEERGHELRRPEADYLRDGIYELRVRFQNVNYRMLYFFYGNTAAVASHGCTKERTVPVREIEAAIERKQRFLENPEWHTFTPEE